ncbi:MAG TPA: hypothetical protein DEP28_11780 [Bacteroidetes bacterium]|nr:hypothetical protein [Bacteroidota bacterium]HCN38447.1 hypothetical protein [Bacteroidota bacterium]
MEIYTLFLLISLAFLFSYLGNLFFINYLNKKKVLDLPNHRSSHKIPTPRGGGIPMLLSFFIVSFIAYLFNTFEFDIHFYIGLFIIFIMGSFEDFKPMSVKLRLFIQILVSIYIIIIKSPFLTFPLPEPFNFNLNYYIAFILNIIWIVGVINIYNFLDGIDGYAGLQGIIVCISSLLLFSPNENSITIYILLFTLFGFMFVNFPPAKIFMGDAGAYGLGFIFAVLPYYIFENYSTGVFTVSMFLWFFLADSLYTIIRRLKRKEKIFDAHRSHLYQRLNILGWSHKKINLFIIPLMILLSGIQIINSYFNYKFNLLVFIVAVIIFFIFAAIVIKLEKINNPQI